MQSQLSMTRQALRLQIALIVMGAIAAVLAFSGAICFMIYLSVLLLRLTSGFYAEATRLLQSMPALQFVFLLAIACSVAVIGVKLLCWAYRSIKAEVHYAAIK